MVQGKHAFEVFHTFTFTGHSSLLYKSKVVCSRCDCLHSFQFHFSLMKIMKILAADLSIHLITRQWEMDFKYLRSIGHTHCLKQHLWCRILQDYREHCESIVRDQIESLTLNGQNKLQDTDVNALSIANKIWIIIKILDELFVFPHVLQRHFFGF